MSKKKSKPGNGKGNGDPVMVSGLRGDELIEQEVVVGGTVRFKDNGELYVVNGINGSFLRIVKKDGSGVMTVRACKCLPSSMKAKLPQNPYKLTSSTVGASARA